VGETKFFFVFLAFPCDRGIRLSGETVGMLGKADRFFLICQERAGRPLKIRESVGHGRD